MIQIDCVTAQKLMPNAEPGRKIRYFADQVEPRVIIAIEWMPWPNTGLVHVATDPSVRGKYALDFGTGVLRSLPHDAILLGWISTKDKLAQRFACAAGFRRLCVIGDLIQYRWYDGHYR